MKSDIEKIKGKNSIFRFGDYIVVLGKKLYVFTVGGSCVFCRPDIVNAYKVAYVPDNKLLVDICDKKYVLISLPDGKDICSIPQTEREFGASHFAISTSHENAFDFYWRYDAYYLVCIDLRNAQTSEYAIKLKYRAVSDIVCDHTGIPCLLQAQYSEIANKRVSENAMVYQCQVPMDIHPQSRLNNISWQFEGKRIAHSFVEGADRVLTNDLHIYYPATKKIEYLLENEESWKPQALSPSTCYLDKSKRYAVLKYSNANVVVGLEERKVVAKYAAQYLEGCIVENEFWVSSDLGIQRKPFPIIEDVPEIKLGPWKR